LTLLVLVFQADAVGAFILDIALEQLNFEVVTIGDEPDEILRRNKTIKAARLGTRMVASSPGGIEMS